MFVLETFPFRGRHTHLILRFTALGKTRLQSWERSSCGGIRVACVKQGNDKTPETLHTSKQTDRKTSGNHYARMEK